LNRSTFPNTIDTFLEHYDIQGSDMVMVNRYKDLKLKTTLSVSEQTELSNLTTTLREKIFTPEDFNKLQDCIVNMENFIRDNVTGYITTKQNEFTTFVSDNKNTLEAEITSGITQIEDKKNFFIGFVNTKEDEVRTIVQEFDSNTARYYTTWSAYAGQGDFNIFSGSNTGLPVDANLNISEENVDLVINGTLMTPYVDYSILNNGLYNILRLTPSSASLIGNGTEVVAKWFKNVGKLYFKHASSHGAGSSDALTVTEGMLESTLANKINKVNKKITASLTSPSSPELYEIWIDVG